jgi:putative addiction module killer protein
MEIAHYVAADRKDFIQTWIDELNDLAGRVAILRRIDRLALGSFGDHKYCRDGVWELRVDYGPGYRVYYSRAGKMLILLLCAGSKRTQTTDINLAVKYWEDYRKRSS